MLRRWIAINDHWVEDQLRHQDWRAGSVDSGTVRDGFGLASPHAAAGFIRILGTALACPESRYFGQEELSRRLLAAVRALLSLQHPDGTIDLLTTNFHSPPDTAFVVEPLAALAVVMDRGSDPGLADVRAGLREFLLRAEEALIRGGIHTPNHRWVVAAALAQLYALSGNSRCVDRIEQWLAEGIDQNGDGQFSELSSGVYSPTCDWAFVTMARILGRDVLLDPVRRNLDHTLFLIEPNGEVVTRNSRRQDREMRGSLRRYHLPFRYMALRDGSPVYAALARRIEDLHGDELAGDLVHVLADPGLSRELPDGDPPGEVYRRDFSASNLFRVRRSDMSLSLFRHNPALLSAHFGTAVLDSLRVASAFFGKGQFRGDGFEVSGESVRMRQDLDGPYYQPLEPVHRHPEGEWSDAQRSLRSRSEVQHLSSQLEVVEIERGWDVRLQISGTERVPVAVELTFRRGGSLSGVEPVPGVADAFLLGEGRGEYRLGRDRIVFGPGAVQHTWTQLRGAEPKADGLSVYLTGSTPFRHTIRLET